jgi:LacI family transcriptional regulator, galactose operon repressor
MTVTINDVARKAKVSVATVSRVIHDSILISEKTKTNVKKTIKDLDYKPFAKARKLIKKNLRAAALLIPDIKNVFYPLVIRGVEDELEKNGYSLFICNTDENIEKERKYLDTLIDKGVGGMIFLGTRPAELKQQYIINLSEKMPVLMINDYMIGSNVYSVMTDETEGAFQAVNYLIKLGHRKIAFINGDVDYTTYRYKYRGYEKALETNSMEFVENYHIKVTPYEEGGYLGTKKILQMGKNKPTAIFTASDQIAVGVYKAIYEAGLKIPEDFSVVGFSGIPLSKELFPELTTVDQFAYNTGSKAGNRKGSYLSRSLSSEILAGIFLKNCKKD